MGARVTEYHRQKLEQRGQMIGMFNAGVSKNDIAQQLGVSSRTVSRWISRWQAEGNLVDHPKTGRHRKTTAAQDEEIIAMAINSPFINAQIINNELNPGVTRTIHKRLHERGYYHRVPAIKPKLTDENRAGRLRFANEYVNRDLDFWAKVIFTDEKTFASSTHGRVHLWRLNQTRYDRNNISEVPKSGHITLNIWGWMSYYNIGETARIEGRFTGDQYVEILEEVMLPSVRAINFPYPEVFYFVQDRCPIHTSRVARNFFDEHPEIQLLDWPSKGCDMNPIENLWAIMVNEWDIRDERNPETLWRHVIEVWEGIRRRPTICQNLDSSMPRRLRTVIEKDGGWNKY